MAGTPAQNGNNMAGNNDYSRKVEALAFPRLGGDPLNTSEARVMRLKGYGNALVAPAAQAFIEAAMECIA